MYSDKKQEYYNTTERKDMNRKSRKTMAIYGALHPNSDIDRLYVKRKEAPTGLMSVENCIKEEENSLGFYIANSDENLIRRVAVAETIDAKDTVISR